MKEIKEKMSEGKLKIFVRTKRAHFGSGNVFVYHRIRKLGS